MLTLDVEHFDPEEILKIAAETMTNVRKFLEFEMDAAVRNSVNMAELMGKVMVYRLLLDAMNESFKKFSGG